MMKFWMAFKIKNFQFFLGGGWVESFISICLFGLGGKVHKGDEQSFNVVCTKDPNKVDGCKLHTMVADKKIRQHRENYVIDRILPL